MGLITRIQIFDIIGYKPNKRKREKRDARSAFIKSNHNLPT